MRTSVKILFFMVLVLIMPEVLAQQERIDSLNFRLKTATDSEKVMIHCELSRLYLDSSPILSLRNAQIAADISTEHNWDWGLAEAHNRLGNVYLYATDYSKALEYYLNSLSMRIKEGNQQGMADSYNNIALVYVDINNYSKAREYTLKSMEINQLSGNKRSIAVNYNNLAVVAMMKEYVDSALTYLSNAVTLYKEIGDKSGIADAFNNIADLYKTTGKYNQALDYQRQALKYYESTNNKYGEAISLITLGEIMMEKGDYIKARKYLMEPLPLTLKKQWKDLTMQILSNLADVYAKQGAYADALIEQHLFNIYQDSVYAREINDKILESQMKFDADQQLQNIQLLKNDRELKKVEMQKHKSLALFLLSFASLVLIVTLLINLIIRNRKNVSVTLQEKNSQLFRLNENLIASERKLKNLNKVRDQFFSIIAHDLISPFNSLLGLSEILNRDTESLKKKDIKKYSEWILLSARNLLHLLENLLQWSGAQSGKLKNNPKYLNLNEHVNNVIRLLGGIAHEKRILLVSEISADQKAFADPNLISTILRNLVGNAIKFTLPGGTVTIKCAEKNTMLEISVSDTGVGIPQENIEKLFKLNQSFTTKGTIHEEGTGLGLIICKEFVEMIGGTIEAKSTPEKGSTFSFTVPSIPIRDNLEKT